jgi:hypothetical protein
MPIDFLALFYQILIDVSASPIKRGIAEKSPGIEHSWVLMMQTEKELYSYLQENFSRLPFARFIKIVRHSILQG